MSKGLPLEVLGLVSPFLSIIEGGERRGLPEHWALSRKPFAEQEMAWLQRELPTYSLDNLDEILGFAHNPIRQKHLHQWHPQILHENALALSPPPGFDIMDAFHKLAIRYLSWNGNELFIREGMLVEMHELGLRFPVRHLIRYSHAEAAMRGFMPKTTALKKSSLLNDLHSVYHGLRTVINRGIYEGHLHLNSILTPHETWANHLLCGHAFLKGMDRQAWRLVVLGRKSVQLMALGLLLDRVPSKNAKVPFHLLRILDLIFYAKTNTELKCLLEAFDSQFLTVSRAVNAALMEKGGSLNSEMAWLISILNPSVDQYFHSTNPSFPRPSRHTMRNQIHLLGCLHFYLQYSLILNDQTVPWQEPNDPNWKPNNEAAKKALTKPPNPIRHFLHEVFYRYLIFQGMHWQGATQSGKTTGLRHFVGKYYAKQRKSISDYLEASSLAFERMANQEPLRGVEGRIGPPSSPEDSLHWLLAFSKNFREEKLDHFGFIVHFIKSNKEEPNSSMGTPPFPVLRHAHIRRKIRHDAVSLFRFLSIPNPVAPFIVGIDAANLELTTPPEIFAPAFRFLRDYPIKHDQIGMIQRVFGQHHPFYFDNHHRRMGMTYHVGEDFRHLLSGLRAIHEVIEFLKPIAGDRLGHATALALSPRIWLDQNGHQAILDQQEWLDSLVWIHHFLGSAHPLIDDLQIADRIQQLSRNIYGSTQKSSREVDQDWSIASLYDSWRLRQLDPYSIDLKVLNEKNDFQIRNELIPGKAKKRWLDIQREVLNDINQYVGTNAAYRLLGLYWFNADAKKQGERKIKVDMHRKKDIWIAICLEAQKKMVELISQKQLVIEANPTSNRLIGPMSSFGDHPIFPLTLDSNKKLLQKIRVTINTDNPGVMATSLTHEYYLLGEILLNQGIAEPDVEVWLEWLRNNGKSCSFLNLLPPIKKEELLSFFDALESRYPAMSRIISNQPCRYKPSLDPTKAAQKDLRNQEQMTATLHFLRKENSAMREALTQLQASRQKNPTALKSHQITQKGLSDQEQLAATLHFLLKDNSTMREAWEKLQASKEETHRLQEDEHDING